ncbi:hypothetical protein BDK51DRAFT_15881 [Blyttiomyces helicus]|uniref:Uncharacterized protein n=1 Tax=Blyttiomyces helicus TaxID=388810 RepID=A0A4V1IPF0_9FUNG|nr:hypothetical protein BDK51DRAFT_15881 [Blyttiomyces helicus]|eukprot:RKO82827.1 hypothetical protein BDK51DRAFT_15881 [Blyttiomyces helicus]
MADAPNLNISTLFAVKGKVALVTGGGTGIGKMIAAALVQNGAKVYIASRKLKVVESAAAELNAMGPGTCVPLAADLLTKASCDALAAQIIERESALHLLFNNAGVAWGSPLEKTEEGPAWDKLMALNVKVPFYLTVA